MKRLTESGQLLTQAERERMLENGRRRLRGMDERGLMPVVKLFTPGAKLVFLLTEIDPEDPDIVFGLCDLGAGYPELCRVRFSEIEAIRFEGMRVVRDRRFRAEKTLGEYAQEALDRKELADHIAGGRNG